MMMDKVSKDSERDESFDDFYVLHLLLSELERYARCKKIWLHKMQSTLPRILTISVKSSSAICDLRACVQLKQQFALDMQHVLCLALIWRLVSVLSGLK